MKDAQKPDHVSLNTLIGWLKEGRFVIPDFQREFEWRPSDIRALMRSIFMDYFIGSLLLWKGKPENFEALACEPIYGFTGDGKRDHIVLDGQQRLTAMYYTFLLPEAPLPNRNNRYWFYIRVDKFMNGDYDEAFDSDWLTKRHLQFLQSKEGQFQSHVFPLSVVGSGGWDLFEWCQGYVQFWKGKTARAAADGDAAAERLASTHAENATKFGDELKGITEQYQISYIELDQELAIDKVCDIFTQINSKGIRLDIFDLVNALLKPKGLQLKHMWREAAPRLAFVDNEKMNVYVLQVMSVLRQTYCSPKYLYYLLPGVAKNVRDPDGTLRKEVLVPDTADFETRWNRAVSAMEKAIAMLRHPQEFGVVSSGYLPYVSILPVFAALEAEVESLPATRRLDAQRKVRHWYWASVFTGRYSGSVESTSARDFLSMKAWLDDDEAEPAPILEFKTRFRSLDLRSEVKHGTSVYNGIFNLLVIKGARDWITGNIPQAELDDHHIVPASWTDNASGSLINSILNRTPLSSDTNRKIIRDRLPNQYLPELIAANGESAVRATLESHLISPAAFNTLLRKPFTPPDFEEFLSERQRTIQDAIEDLLVKERLDLAPRPRELDAAIEKVELGLRAVIANAVDGTPNALPSSVEQRANERIEMAARKNSGLDVERYQTVAGKLEYCDLRELEATIVNKPLWPLFEASFSSKELLATRFGQLAELRNQIRHSRTVDEVARKDGEAAILWFELALTRAPALTADGAVQKE